MAVRQADERVPISFSHHPRGQVPPCGYVQDTETREQCGAPPEYVFRLHGRDAKGSACAEHARIVRTWRDLAWIRDA